MDLRQVANQQKYDFTASIYDFVAFVMSLGQAKRIYRQVARTINPNTSATIIELGCGPASVIPHLLECTDASNKIIGVDFSEEMIKRAYSKKHDNGWDNVEFECMDMYDYPEGMKADVVIFCLALTAIPDASKALEKALSILNPGGQLIIADSFPLHTRWWHPFTNFYITMKSMVVGAKPSDKALQFIKSNLVEEKVEEMVGGVYTLISARKKAYV